VVSQRRPIVIGVAGGSGSGKTTVARSILAQVTGDQVPGAAGEESWEAAGIACIQHDAYYRDASRLPQAERARLNFDHPEALETSLLVEHLQALRRGEEVHIPVYDYRTHSRLDRRRRVRPEPVILVEGILIFAEPALRTVFDVKIFVDTDPDLRFIRRLQRDVEERDRSLEVVVEQYLHTVRPMHMEFVEPSKRHADVIIPEGGHNTVALEMVAARVRALLEEAR
jgi:uridine kinase